MCVYTYMYVWVIFFNSYKGSLTRYRDNKPSYHPVTCH